MALQSFLFICLSHYPEKSRDKSKREFVYSGTSDVHLSSHPLWFKGSLPKDQTRDGLVAVGKAGAGASFRCALITG